MKSIKINTDYKWIYVTSEFRNYFSILGNPPRVHWIENTNSFVLLTKQFYDTAILCKFLNDITWSVNFIVNKSFLWHPMATKINHQLCMASATDWCVVGLEGYISLKHVQLNRAHADNTQSSLLFFFLFFIST